MSCNPLVAAAARAESGISRCVPYGRRIMHPCKNISTLVAALVFSSGTVASDIFSPEGKPLRPLVCATTRSVELSRGKKDPTVDRTPVIVKLNPGGRLRTPSEDVQGQIIFSRMVERLSSRRKGAAIVIEMDKTKELMLFSFSLDGKHAFATTVDNRSGVLIEWNCWADE